MQKRLIVLVVLLVVALVVALVAAATLNWETLCRPRVASKITARSRR